MAFRILLPAIVFIAYAQSIFSQTGKPDKQNGDAFVKSITMQADTATYTTDKHLLSYKDEQYLFFEATSKKQTVSVHFKVRDTVNNITIKPSSAYKIRDSVTYFADQDLFKAGIQFSGLEEFSMPALVYNIQLNDSSSINKELKLNPYFETAVINDKGLIQVFQEEEKTIELPAKNLYNIDIESKWIKKRDYDYKLVPAVNHLNVIIRPHRLGNKSLQLDLRTIDPFLTNHNQLTHNLPPVKINFNVKPNRLIYLNTDKEKIYYSKDFSYNAQLQFEYSPYLSMNKSYRIENEKNEGGRLIAELHTQSVIGDNEKILCRLRTFSLHNQKDGYLYIKDDGKARFITNFNIIEKPAIEKVSVLRNGQDWSDKLQVYPGEEIEVKIEGKGLTQPDFTFEEFEQVQLDTSRKSNEALFYSMKVPLDISKTKTGLYMNKKPTRYRFNIKEYQRPRQLDFVNINYGGKPVPLSDRRFNKPVFYDEVIKDITISFDRNKIDKKKLHGRQYLDVEVKLINTNNDLIEIREMNDILVCPGTESPRHNFYNLDNCYDLNTINLNDILAHNTYNLDAYTQIVITLKHNKERHGFSGHKKKIKIILRRQIKFDLQVSFPAGLLIKKFNEAGYGNLTGVSISAIAQFSFYDQDKFNTFKPYTIGAGFVAINTFNFDDNSAENRDIGLVILGTISPLNSGDKFAFPLYAGGGYLLKNNTAFLLFGPGLRVRF